jgi:UDP-N-acetylglucosamine acyltransferase
VSTTIHPAAVVMPGAELGADCEIGPFAYVGPHVKLGDGCRLHPHAMVEGHTSLGPRCEVFPFACIGGKTQDLKWKGGTAFVEVGAGCTFREYVTIHASTQDGGRTVVGNDCHLLAYCHIAHDCTLGDRVVMSNSTQLAGHVTVEDHVTFGGMGGAVQFVRIGRFSMVGATAKVVQDVTPFTLVDGAPAEPRMINKVGLERAGFTPEQLRALLDVYRIFFRGGLRAEEAIAKIRVEFANVPEALYFAEFAEKSGRGVARPRG